MAIWLSRPIRCSISVGGSWISPAPTFRCRNTRSHQRQPPERPTCDDTAGRHRRRRVRHRGAGGKLDERGAVHSRDRFAQGRAGAQGTQGTQGSQGSVGAQGPQGATGAQGPQGTTGRRVSVGRRGQVRPDIRRCNARRQSASMTPRRGVRPNPAQGRCVPARACECGPGSRRRRSEQAPIPSRDPGYD